MYMLGSQGCLLAGGSGGAEDNRDIFEFDNT